MKTCERKSKEPEASEKFDLSKLRLILDKHRDHEGVLIPVLQEVQKEYGYLAQEILHTIAKDLSLPLSQVYGVATFYSQFRLQPHGDNTIRVCHGTACHVSGAQEISAAIEKQLGIVSGGTTKDRKFTLDTVACLGCCSLAPVLMINEETHGRLTASKAKKVVRKYGKS
jgi:NADH-quinone oxidoreductase E subunit